MRVKIADAARILDMPKQAVRIGLQREKLPIGYAVQRTANSKWAYYINPVQLASYAGLSLQELKKAVAAG